MTLGGHLGTKTTQSPFGFLADWSSACLKRGTEVKEFKTDKVCPDWTTGQQKTEGEGGLKRALGIHLTLHRAWMNMNTPQQSTTKFNPSVKKQWAARASWEFLLVLLLF